MASHKFKCYEVAGGRLRHVGGCNLRDGGLRGAWIVDLKGLARTAAGDQENRCDDKDKCNSHFHFLPFQ